VVQPVGSRPLVTRSSTGASAPSNAPSGGFAQVLSSLFKGTSSGASTPSAASISLGRTNLTQALHYLKIQSRPAASTQFGPFAAVSSFLKGLTVRTTSTTPTSAVATATTPMRLDQYPRPAGDNGRGMHWIPTTSQSKAVVDQYVNRLQKLNTKWVTFLNQEGDLKSNDYLVTRLKEAGIMPVMRIYTDSGAALINDVTPLVKHFKSLGVDYFQLFNEPNLKDENQGQLPSVKKYVNAWLPAARQVVAAGGLPGVGALSPQGDANDLSFLKETLQSLKAAGADDVLGKSWLSIHNYGKDFLRTRQYDQVTKSELGRSLPMIGTEAGIYPDAKLSETEQVKIVSDAYNYLPQREPAYFAYSLWVLANQAGGGHDARWEHQALYRQDGPSTLARALEGLSATA
jgi:hypothetical protein